MVLDMVAFDADDVATHGHFARLQVHTNTGGFERSAAFVHPRQIITQYGHIGHLASRMETVGHRHQTARASHAGQPVHVGCVGSL